MRSRNPAYEGVLVGKALLARDTAVRQLLPGRVIAQDVTCNDTGTLKKEGSVAQNRI
jgi:hypothetical protein